MANPLDFMQNLPPNVQAQVQTEINRMQNGQGPQVHDYRSQREQTLGDTAQNYLRNHPDAAPGFPTPDGQNLQFNTRGAGLVTVGADHATTTVQLGDGSAVTARPDNSLTVTAPDGQSHTFTGSSIAQDMVAIGNAAANDRSHGANFIGATNANELGNDARQAIGVLASPTTPAAPAGAPQSGVRGPGGR